MVARTWIALLALPLGLVMLGVAWAQESADSQSTSSRSKLAALEQRINDLESQVAALWKSQLVQPPSAPTVAEQPEFKTFLLKSPEVGATGHGSSPVNEWRIPRLTR